MFACSTSIFYSFVNRTSTLISIFFLILKSLILTCIPKHEPPSHLPPHNISLGHPHAPAPSMLYPASDIDWRFDSYMIVYMLECHSPKSSHPLPLKYGFVWEFPGGLDGKESAWSVGDLGLIPGLGRSEEGNDNPLQYSCLENSMDCIVHGAPKSWT